MRSDDGEEYDKSEFKVVCATERISLTRTVSDKVRQNSIAERMNKTLNEWIRSIRIHYGLKIFWVEFVNTIAYSIYDMVRSV